MSSITLTLTGDSSQLSAQYCPAIDLNDDEGGEYVCGLVDFQTFNSIPNIDDSNSLFHFGYTLPLYNENNNRESNEIVPEKLRSINIIEPIETSRRENKIEESIASQEQQQKRKRKKRSVESVNPFKRVLPLTVIQIPTGSYELDHLAKYLQKRVEQKGGKLGLYANNNTLRCELYCTQPIDFSRPNTIGPLLGFYNNQILEPNKTHESQLPANILKVNVIRIECSIIRGSYLNNQPSHSIHEFSPRVPPGYKIIEVPQNVIYFPITVKSIQRIDLSIVDQHNQLINFRGETITIRLHIKRIHR